MQNKYNIYNINYTTTITVNMRATTTITVNIRVTTTVKININYKLYTINIIFTI